MIVARLRRHAVGLGFVLAAFGVAFAVLRHAFANPTLPPGVDTEYHTMYLRFMAEELLPSGALRGWFPYTYNGFTGFLLYPPGFYLFGAALARLFHLSAESALELAGTFCYALYPISCYAFLRLVGYGRSTAWFGGASAFLVHTDFGLGLDGFVRQGALANIFGVPSLVLYLGVLLATCRRVADGMPSGRAAVAAGALLALVVVSHIHSGLIAGSATVLAFASLVSLSPRRRMILLPALKRFVLLGGVALCLSAFFVVPFLLEISEKGPAAGWGTPDPRALARDLVAGRSVAPSAVVLVALVGVGRSVSRVVQRSVAHLTLLLLTVLVTLLTLGWFPAGGPLFPVVYPLVWRALVYLAVLIPLFAAIAVAPILEGTVGPLRERPPVGRRHARLAQRVARFAPLLALLVYASVHVSWDERSMAEAFAARTSDEMHALARELARQVPDGSRFAVEGGGASLRHASYLHYYPFLTLSILSGRSTLQGDSIEQSPSGDHSPLVEHAENAATPEGRNALAKLGVTHVVTTTPEGAAVLGAARGHYTKVATFEHSAIFRLESSSGATASPGTEARVLAVDSRSFHLRVRSRSENATVLVPVAHSQRWHLHVDGRPAPLHEGEHGLLSFTVSGAGDHDVRIEYSNPWSDSVALCISGLGLAVTLLGLTFGRAA
jgi:hypothetical protein